MIIDVHTHTPRYRTKADADAAPPTGMANAPMRPDRPDPSRITWDEYMEAMQAVDRAIVFNIAGPPDGDQYPPGLPEDGIVKREQARAVNDATAAIVQAYPEKLIGFMSVHPRDPQLLEEMDRAVGDLGLRGIKLGPNYQNFDPLGDEASTLFARAQELGLPILLHQGTSPVQFADLDWAHPRHLDRVATRFPKLRVILAHFAHPWQVDALAVIRKHPNVWADISALHYRPWSYWTSLRLATEWAVLHKLLFGSDFPVATPQETIDAIPHINDLLVGTALPRVPVDELMQVVHRDALDILGLD